LLKTPRKVKKLTKCSNFFHFVKQNTDLDAVLEGINPSPWARFHRNGCVVKFIMNIRAYPHPTAAYICTTMNNLKHKEVFVFETTKRRSIYTTQIPSSCESDSSVSVVSGYGLDHRAIEVRSPAGAKGFSSSLYVQTGCGAEQASCTAGTGSPFSGNKARAGHESDLSPHLESWSWMSRSSTSSHPMRLHKCVVGLLYIFAVILTIKWRG
jgi:hypothetical protein